MHLGKVNQTFLNHAFDIANKFVTDLGKVFDSNVLKQYYRTRDENSEFTARLVWWRSKSNKRRN